jgi:hypothetical protein
MTQRPDAPGLPRPDGLAKLTAFFAAAQATARAVRPLSTAACIGLELDEGPASFSMASGAAVLSAGAPASPDFTLRLPAEAVSRLCAHPEAGVGELGLLFFTLARDRDPQRRIGIRIQATTGRLLSNGYLTVLAVGGPRVGLWLLRRGLSDPRAAIERLRHLTRASP